VAGKSALEATGRRKPVLDDESSDEDVPLALKHAPPRAGARDASVSAAKGELEAAEDRERDARGCRLEEPGVEEPRAFLDAGHSADARKELGGREVPSVSPATTLEGSNLATLPLSLAPVAAPVAAASHSGEARAAAAAEGSGMSGAEVGVGKQVGRERVAEEGKEVMRERERERKSERVFEEEKAGAGSKGAAAAAGRGQVGEGGSSSSAAHITPATAKKTCERITGGVGGRAVSGKVAVRAKEGLKDVLSEEALRKRELARQLVVAAGKTQGEGGTGGAGREDGGEAKCRVRGQASGQISVQGMHVGAQRPYNLHLEQRF
jgi:hypothetical protein